MRVLTLDETVEILLGCTVLGTGGGGPLDDGIAMVERVYNDGKAIRLANIDEFPDGAKLISPYYCGSVSQSEDGSKMNDGLAPLYAVQAAESYFNTDFCAMIATELGGANTASAFYVAALMDKPVIDGDPAGRAVPKLQHSTFYINNIPMIPAAVANRDGDTAIFTRVKDEYHAEALIRSFAVVSGNTAGVADHFVTVEQARQGLILGTLSYAWKIGHVLKKAWETKQDAANAVADAGEGRVVFRGTVSSYSWEEKDGFTYGNVYIGGSGAYLGKTLHLWIQNENIMAFVDDEPYITVPELICVFDDKQQRPVVNPNYEKGMELTVVGLPAQPIWESERGLELFGPHNFGFDLDYKPAIRRGDVK